MLKNKVSMYLIVGGMALTGLLVGVATIAGAQSVVTTTTPVDTAVMAQIVDTPEPGDVPDVPDATESKTHGHAPLGGDGIVSSINGTTIVMGEESDEGGASYTIDASKATVTNDGVAAATLADVKVGAKIFVEGSTTGTNVVATSISLGHKGEHADKAGDNDGNASSEASEPAESGDAGE